MLHESYCFIRKKSKFLQDGLNRKSVFSYFIAATKPSANVCVAHGTLCNDPSVHNRIELWLRILSQANSVRFGGALAVTRQTLKFRGNPVGKHCRKSSERLKILSLKKSNSKSYRV